MTDSTARAWATIDLHALKKNLTQARIHSPDAQTIPVIKANAYGHGVEQVAVALQFVKPSCAAFAVASLEEAMQLRAIGIEIPILLLAGFRDQAEMDICLDNKIEPVIHSMYQFEIMDSYLQTQILTGVGRVWVKFNSGMNRLGFTEAEALHVYGDLNRHPETEVILMSHLASADDLESESAIELTATQVAELVALKGKAESSTQGSVQLSLAASAGILAHPQSHHQFVRPGFMLYGGSPFADRTAEELGLLPVMTLSAKIMAINHVKAGGGIGYGATHVCQQDTRVGIVSIGYADGYPRSAPNGTPVLVKTESGSHRSALLGRVSMDMIAIDLNGFDDAKIEDEVVLWGKGLPADEVASYAHTIAYELFCKVTKRVNFIYTDA